MPVTPGQLLTAQTLNAIAPVRDWFYGYRITQINYSAGERSFVPEYFERNQSWWDSANQRVTIPYSGWYLLAGGASWSGSNTLGIRLDLNGQMKSACDHYGGQPWQYAICLVYASAGSWVRLRLVNGLTSTLFSAYFCVALLWKP